MKGKTTSSFLWKLLERTGYVGIQFVVQIILARLIEPAQFGVLAVMTSFTNIIQIFTQSGLNSALIQSNRVEEEDYSAVFSINFIIMSAFYFLAFIFAPVIEKFYEYSNFVLPFRVLAVTFFVSALSSVQVAILTKKLQFKAIFKCSLIGVLISGSVGIYMAYHGYEIWALVVQAVLNQVLNTTLLCFEVKWKPKIFFSVSRIKKLLGYGGKVLLGSLIGEFYNDFSSFIIGKVASAESLAFFKRGKLFPQNISSVVTTTTKSVMYPIMSAQQDDDKTILDTFRMTMRISTYIVTPALLGMLAVARPLIILLLTDKWEESIVYFQIFCIVYVFYQIHGIYTTALNSKGRSDLTLIVQIVLVTGTLIACLLALFVFHSTVYIAWGTVAVNILIVMPLNAYYCNKVLGYSIRMQLEDILPSLLISAAMMGIVLLIGRIDLPYIIMLITQIMCGAAAYIILSYLSKNEGFFYLYEYLKKTRKKGANS